MGYYHSVDTANFHRDCTLIASGSLSESENQRLRSLVIRISFVGSVSSLDGTVTTALLQ
jgi:hypothetical protein